jgi:hypothetical protein
MSVACSLDLLTIDSRTERPSEADEETMSGRKRRVVTYL